MPAAAMRVAHPGTCRAVSFQRPQRCGRRVQLRVSATLETQKLFERRLAQAGFEVPRDLEALHPIAREAWRSIHAIYGAPCFETQLLPAPWLAEQAEGSTVLFKCENRQATGSFKARGAAHKLLSLPAEQLSRGVVAASTGNHALAVLHAAKAAGAAHGGMHVPTRIFLPRTASAAKAGKLRDLGADVQLCGSDCVEAEAAARQAAEREGRLYVSPYNDVEVAGGQGSIAIELLMQLGQQLDAVFVPVGGGGLISGIAAVLKAAAPSVRIIGCQPAASDVMAQSVAAGRVVAAEWRPTLSEGTVGGLEEGAITLEPCTRFVDEWVTVGEEEIARAVIDTVTHSGMQVEGATGVVVAAFHKLAPRMRGMRCVIIACGGNMSSGGMEEVYRVAGVSPRRQQQQPQAAAA